MARERDFPPQGSKHNYLSGYASTLNCECSPENGTVTKIQHVNEVSPESETVDRFPRKRESAVEGAIR